MQVGQGAGYVYMHQGCCEHLVELSDVRCIHHAELLQSQPTFYPLVLKEVRLLNNAIVALVCGQILVHCGSCCGQSVCCLL